MKVAYHPEERRELLAAGGDELHRKFEAEYLASIKQILEDPLRWRIRGHTARRFNLNRFPYYISYIVHGDTLWIVALALGGRKPFYWKGRTKDIG